MIDEAPRAVADAGRTTRTTGRRWRRRWSAWGVLQEVLKRWRRCYSFYKTLQRRDQRPAGTADIYTDMDRG